MWGFMDRSAAGDCLPVFPAGEGIHPAIAVADSVAAFGT